MVRVVVELVFVNLYNLEKLIIRNSSMQILRGFKIFYFCR